MSAVRLIYEILPLFMLDIDVPASISPIPLNETSYPEYFIRKVTATVLGRQFVHLAQSRDIQTLFKCRGAVPASDTPLLGSGSQAHAQLDMRTSNIMTMSFHDERGQANKSLLTELMREHIELDGKSIPLGLSPVYRNKGEIISIYLEVMGLVKIFSKQIKAAAEANMLTKMGGEIFLSKVASNSLLFLAKTLQRISTMLRTKLVRISRIAKEISRQRRMRPDESENKMYGIWNRNQL